MLKVFRLKYICWYICSLYIYIMNYLGEAQIMKAENSNLKTSIAIMKGVYTLLNNSLRLRLFTLHLCLLIVFRPTSNTTSHGYPD